MNIDAPKIKERLSKVIDFVGLMNMLRGKDYDICDLLFQEEFITDYDFSLLNFRGVRFLNCRFINCTFYKCGFYDCVFEGVDLSGSDLGEAFFSRCEINNSKGVGAAMTKTVLKNTVWRWDLLEYANFAQSVWEHCAIKACNLNSAHLSQVKLKGLLFEDTSLLGTDFFQTPLKGLDFTNCQVGAWLLSDNAAELKGGIFTSLQCVELAKRLGVVIKD